MNMPSTSEPARTPSSTGEQRRRAGLWRWLPIRRLAERHRPRVMRHLLSLEPHDRYLRFGYPASDERIVHYVETLDFKQAELFGIFDRRLELVAISQLAYAETGEAETTGRMAEFAVSVRSHARGRGYGQRLFAHAVRHARNRSIDRLMIHALSENSAMLRIARKAGAVVKREGSDAEAWLQLPPYTVGSQVEELLADRVSALNYRLKVKASQVGWLVAVIQEVKARIMRRGHIASH